MPSRKREQVERDNNDDLRTFINTKDGFFSS